MRVFNFSPGPATLPLEVLEAAQAELTDWRGSGMSVLEVSHRSRDFLAVAAAAEADLRELLSIPADYRVLFVQGGATGQFAAVPMNLAGAQGSADYVDSGAWAQKAIAEARRYLKVNVVADGKASGYTQVPQRIEPSDGASYLHYTANETISGVEFHQLPAANGVPLVADVSSTLLSRPIEVKRYGLLYAGAQKNLGPAGLTVVIVRDQLLGHARPGTPSIFDYRAVADSGSMLNTPPTFAWYLTGLVLKWLKRQGGVEAIGERNRQRAAKLYQYIDRSGYYRNEIATDSRSWMNVTFKLATPDEDQAFAKAAARAGLTNLAGHRSHGGLRASLYNALPDAAVDALIGFMEEYARAHGGSA